MNLVVCLSKEDVLNYKRKYLQKRRFALPFTYCVFQGYGNQLGKKKNIEKNKKESI